MDFFQRQQLARKNSRRLVWLFVLAVIGIVVALNIVAGVLYSIMHGESRFLVPPPWWYRDNLTIVAAVSGASLMLIAGASAFRIASLRSGGGTVAEALGGTLVSLDTRDPLERRLRNVVEEMSIASALPVPDVYVLGHEDGINAFAAGFTQSDAAIAVTRGALEKLNRDELQGVIAHEFSHVLNGDMRLNLRLVGILFGILVIGQAGRMILRSGSRGRVSVRSSGGNKGSGVAIALVLGLALFAIGYIGVFFGRLIKAGVSRQREYLADASAVQFTRQNLGIAGALKKIAGLGQGSRMQTARAEEISHMLFASGMRFFSGWMATHPPIEDRIRALEPGFKDLGDTTISGSGLVAGAAGFAAGATKLTGHGMVGHAGSIDDGGISHAAGLLSSLPESVLEDIQSPTAAPKVMLALLLSKQPGQRQDQVALIAGKLGAEVAADILRIREVLGGLTRQLRLPVLELCFPALRRLPQAKLDFFHSLARELVERDGHIDYQEFALLQVLGVYLEDLQHPGRRTRKRQVKRKIIPALARVFALLAKAGNPDAAAARKAYESAISGLPGIQKQIPPWSEQTSDLQQISRDLSLLDQLPPAGKRTLIQAMTDLMLQDQRAEILELEILRCFAASMHIPLPPMELVSIENNVPADLE
jgi:Zn-dependent protease with chaperone function